MAIPSVPDVAVPTVPAQAPRRRSVSPFASIWHFIAWLGLVGIAILFLIPLFWMISTALKEPSELMRNNWIPQRLAWENFSYALSYGMWFRWTFNSVVITVLSVVGMVLSSAMVAYAFARLRWPGRDFLFGIVLATMMMPGVVLMIPQFIIFARLPAFGFQGSQTWVNTFLPLIVPTFTGSAFYIFLQSQFMRGVPMELSESAKIDGASEFKIFWNIVMPLSKPALATIAIFSFQGAWQDFMGPLIYLQSERLYTLQLGLRQFEFAAGGAPAWNWLMAVSLLVMLPVLAVFLAFQRYFIEGISITGMGGR